MARLKHTGSFERFLQHNMDHVSTIRSDINEN